MAIDDRPTIAAPDDDPYLWLEEIEGERALDFVDRQSRLTLETFGGRQFATDRDTLAAIYDRTDNIPYVTRRGGLVYNLWKDAKNPRGLWRRTTLADFRKAEPGWETLLDIDRLAAEEDEDWLLNWTATAAGKLAARSSRLSRGGSDAVTLREFDLDTKAFVADGFTLPEAKSGVEWVDADTLLLSSALGEGMATTSGYAQNRPAVAPRRARGTRAGAVRSAGRPDGRVLQRRRHRADAADVVHRSDRFLQSQSLARRPRPVRAQSSICRPTSGWKRIATGWP